MKNIYVIPTDVPSRLISSGKEFNLLQKSTIDKRCKNIYITSDEEIKEKLLLNKTDYYYVKNHYNEWYVGKFNGNSFDFTNDNGNFNSNLFVCKKIILTTDQDLIADGVQAIDDDFLEWFVKNPSCEEVKVRKKPKVNFIVKGKGIQNFNNGYKIIIPQEKQIKCYCGHTTYCDCSPLDEAPNMDKQVLVKMWESAMPKLEPKQETTIEEAAEIFVNNRFAKQISGDKTYPDIYASKEAIIESHILFAKWQAERMYSEEDLREAYLSAIKTTGEGWNGEYAEGNDPNIEEKFSEGFTQWFEQFKKK